MYAYADLKAIKAAHTTINGTSADDLDKDGILLVRKLKDAIFKVAAAIGIPKAINALAALHAALPLELQETQPICELNLSADTLTSIGHGMFKRTYGDAYPVVQPFLWEICPDLGFYTETLVYGFMLACDSVTPPLETSFAIIAAIIPAETPKQAVWHLNGAHPLEIPIPIHLTCTLRMDDVRRHAIAYSQPQGSAFLLSRCDEMRLASFPISLNACIAVLYSIRRTEWTYCIFFLALVTDPQFTMNAGPNHPLSLLSMPSLPVLALPRCSCSEESVTERRLYQELLYPSLLGVRCIKADNTLVEIPVLSSFSLPFLIFAFTFALTSLFTSAMDQRLVVVAPSHVCPFYVQALQYTPHDSHDDGVTLLLFHAMMLHKETYHTMLTSLLQVPGLRIKDVWCIENPNHGRSAVMNTELLDSPQYRERCVYSDCLPLLQSHITISYGLTGTAREYARAIYTFLSATSHGVDFRRRKLVGMGHSAGGVALMSLLEMRPKIRFEAILLLDAGVAPAIKSSLMLLGSFIRIASSKMHTWDSLEEAIEALASQPAFKAWHPDIFKSFIAYGLKPVGSSSKAVKLTLSPIHEATYYASDYILGPAAKTFVDLTREDSIPIHVIIASPDEYKGRMNDLKSFQIQHVSKMSRSGVHYVERGGHLFPQSEPALAAQAIRKALEFINAQKEVERPYVPAERMQLAHL
ncbi:hypothetical protein HGRIS_000882 [Hohenbuehelia grisea]|uniref:AB hydrolase-1 domain-containing protein n=1 Tax=Hohenbuehelia grisea TaxID=104357 RepID=A0ABR3IQ19_9AGAR